MAVIFVDYLPAAHGYYTIPWSQSSSRPIGVCEIWFSAKSSAILDQNHEYFKALYLPFLFLSWCVIWGVLQVEYLAQIASDVVLGLQLSHGRACSTIADI